MASSGRRVLTLLLLMAGVLAISFNLSSCIAATTDDTTDEGQCCTPFITSYLAVCNTSDPNYDFHETCCILVEEIIVDGTLFACLCCQGSDAIVMSINDLLLTTPTACSNLLESAIMSNYCPWRRLEVVINVVPAILLLTATCGLILYPRLLDQHKRMKNRELKSIVLVRYSYQEMCGATQNFHSSQFLGKGGFGPVYKGEIKGETVAVKCLNSDSKQGFEEFEAEIKIINDLHHRNIIRLLGWCYEVSKCFLIYEYLAKGSLDTILYNDERCRNELSWQRRFGIVLDLASAVQHLHEECNTTIIHRDIKTSNMLLDDEYVLKLGDFGLSRQIEDLHTLTTMVAGTRGYIAPEVFMNGKSTTESDIYSFGAVLAEVACGKRVVGQEGVVLVDWVWGQLGAGTLIKAADERLGGDFNEEEVERVLLVALACSHPDPLARPSIRQAMKILRGKAALPNVPLNKPNTLSTATQGRGPTTTSSLLSYQYGTTYITSISVR